MANRDWRVGNFRVGEAQSQGIDVAEVVKSLATHLTEQKKKQRETTFVEQKFNLVIKQTSNAHGITWETISELPLEVPQLIVSASSWEASRNKMSVQALLEQRIKTKLANELIRLGHYREDLEGRRAATDRAINATIFVADFDLLKA